MWEAIGAIVGLVALIVTAIIKARGSKLKQEALSDEIERKIQAYTQLSDKDKNLADIERRDRLRRLFRTSRSQVLRPK